MTSRIGSDLRRARARREIGLSEVEAATRIRTRFLDAIEQEEWDALPGGVYTRGFIRTYASFLGLDGDRLAEDFRRDVEGAQPPEAAVPVPQSKLGASLRGSPLPLVIAVGGVILVATVAIVAIPTGGDGNGSSSQPAARHPAQQGAIAGGTARAAQPTEGVSMRLSAEGEVWVCVLGAGGRRLVDGQILEAGSTSGPFRSDSFTISFGNGDVTMTVDGKKAEIPATSSPIGYSIDSSGALTELSESKRPTCE